MLHGARWLSCDLFPCLTQDGLLPRWVPDFSRVSDTPFQLTSFALSLMLVFRTNSSYARWLDARQQVRCARARAPCRRGVVHAACHLSTGGDAGDPCQGPAAVCLTVAYASTESAPLPKGP